MKRRQVLILSVSVMLFMLAYATFFICDIYRELKNNRSNRLWSNTFMLDGWLSESFDISEFFLKTMLSKLPLETLQYPPADIDEYRMYSDNMNQMRKLIPNLVFSGIVNKDGILFLSNSVDGFDLSERDFFKEMTNKSSKDSMISNVFISPEGYPLVAQGLKFGDSKNDFKGLGLIAVNLDFFSNGIEKIRYEGSGRVSIIDSNGILLARNTEEQLSIGEVFTEVPLDSVKRSARELNSFIINSDSGGRKNILAVRKMDQYPFYIVIEEENTILRDMIFPSVMIILGTAIVIILAYIVMSSMLSQIKINEELKEALNELEIYFSNSLIGIVILRGNRKIYRVNKRMAEMLGYDSLDYFSGRSVEEFHVSKKNFDEFGDEIYKKLSKRDAIQVEYPLKHKNGSHIWMSISGQAIDQHNPPDLTKGVVWIFENITKRREAEQILIETASIDSMTGLNNRRHYIELAKREFTIYDRRERPLSILMVDIDHFKRINDTLGHAVGDKAITFFAEICKQNLRAEDIAGRIGGEEFACLLPETEIEKAVQVAERIRARTEELTAANTRGIPPFTVSIGIAVLKNHLTLEELMNHSDQALYNAKNKGRNRVEIYKHSTDKIVE